MRIACVHQGYELYGSDRCFVESVAALRHAFPEAEIEAVLPREGPIVAALAPHCDRVVFEPIVVLRRRGFARLVATSPIALPRALWRARARMRRADLTYINTSVVLDYQFAARGLSRKILLHIHEIPTGATRRVLRALALWSGAQLIFNSSATRDVFSPPPRAGYEVIYNGIDGPAAPEPTTYDGSRPLRIALIGRINRIKGQDVLIEALKGLGGAVSIEARLVGGAFENPAAVQALRDQVDAAGLGDRVSVEPFLDDPVPVYRWADIVVAPSKLPESLGRTAIEAMAFGRPALVSAIGGLTEVIADGVTGWHVPPGNARALGAKLASIAARPGEWRGYGAAARIRYERHFSRAAAARALTAVAAERLARAPQDAGKPPGLQAKAS